MINNNYSYSRLTSHFIKLQISSHYKISEPFSCQYFVSGLHDNYLIQNSDNKFLLRVYRNDWRNLDEINFELDLLSFLGEHNAPVAMPIKSIDNTLSFTIECPEGNRIAVLFHYANGEAPGANLSAGHALLLGQAVATIHQKASLFHSPHNRPVLDLAYLLDDSLQTIFPFLTDTEITYLTRLQQRVHAGIPRLSREPPTFGICTGDVNLSNFHIDDQRRITVFDFDQCGYGFRAFEIGKFFASIHGLPDKDKISQAFLTGYQQVHPLGPEEIQAIPHFVITSVLWVMAIHVHNVEHIGYKLLARPFWERRLAVVRTLEEKVLK